MPLADPRPDFAEAVDALLIHACGHVRAFHQLNPQQLLVVAGAARESSRATIRFLDEKSLPRVMIDGVHKRFEITLRPLFFLDANGLGRLMTLFHELLHMEENGEALSVARRHAGHPKSLDAQVEKLARAYALKAPSKVLACLGHNGEVLMRQWRIRPGAGSALKRMTQAPRRCTAWSAE